MTTPITNPLTQRVVDRHRLLLIVSIARVALSDLRERPDDLAPVLAHLSDIVELAGEPHD